MDAEDPSATEVPDVHPPDARSDVVVGSVRARFSNISTNTTIGTVVVSPPGESSYRVPVTDLLSLHRDQPFVEPAEFSRLIDLLAPGGVALCHGPDGCGKEMAVVRALQARNGTAIRSVPGSLGVNEIGRAVESLAADGIDCVITGSPDPTLRALCGPLGDHVRAVARTHDIRVVITASGEVRQSWKRSVPAVGVTPPDAQRLVDAYCSALDADQRQTELVQAVVDELEAPIGPAVVAAIVRDVVNGEAQDVSEFVTAYGSTACVEALMAWMGETGKSASEVAALAAGTTLSGVDTVVAGDQAAVLGELLAEALRVSVGSATSQEPVFTAGPIWPAPFLTTASARVGTHFGVHDKDVVRVCAPYRPHELLQTLWTQLGPAFRRGYLAWLKPLSAGRGLRWCAAYAAGVLFDVDPVVIEEQVLRPWALSDDVGRRRCAGIALGVPVAVDGNAGTARRLAHGWANGGNPRLNQAAVAAYGGLLGAWDSPFIAPMHLVRIGERVPALARETRVALAALVASGPEAVQARAGVLTYLHTLLRDDGQRAMVFSCLPFMVQALTNPTVASAGSRDALQAEDENWNRFCELLATALVTPAGFEAGEDCLLLVVSAVAGGWVDYAVAEQLVRGMKAVTSREFLPRLRDCLAHSLGAVSRTRSDEVGSEELRAVAAALLDQFVGGR